MSQIQDSGDPGPGGRNSKLSTKITYILVISGKNIGNSIVMLCGIGEDESSRSQCTFGKAMCFDRPTVWISVKARRFTAFRPQQKQLDLWSQKRAIIVVVIVVDPHPLQANAPRPGTTTRRGPPPFGTQLQEHFPFSQCRKTYKTWDIAQFEEISRKNRCEQSGGDCS